MIKLKGKSFSFCLLCSQLGFRSLSLCGDCQNKFLQSHLIFENGVGSFLWMSHEISNFVVSLKDGVRPKESHWLGQILAQKYVESLVGEGSKSIPLVCFPPSHLRARLAADHAELLALGVAHTLGSPQPMRLFQHHGSTEDKCQKTKKRHDRRELSLQLIDPPRVKGCSYILVDDVSTSGATLLAMERALLRAGAQVIAKLTLAQTPLRSALPPK